MDSFFFVLEQWPNTDNWSMKNSVNVFHLLQVMTQFWKWAICELPKRASLLRVAVGFRYNLIEREKETLQQNMTPYRMRCNLVFDVQVKWQKVIFRYYTNFTMFKRIVKCIASHNDTVIAQENTLMADERWKWKIKMKAK